MDEILWCYYSNETSSAVLSHGTIYLVCSSNFWICRWNPMVLPFKWNLFRSTFTCYYLLGLYLLVVIPRLQFPWPDHSYRPQQKLSMAFIFYCTILSSSLNAWIKQFLTGPFKGRQLLNYQSCHVVLFMLNKKEILILDRVLKCVTQSNNNKLGATFY